MLLLFELFYWSVNLMLDELLLYLAMWSSLAKEEKGLMPGNGRIYYSLAKGSGMFWMGKKSPDET
jgi:hypothetical protein